MARITPRLWWDNKFSLAATTIAASSEEVNKVSRRTVNETRSKTWRSLIGWNIIAGFNDLIDVDESISGNSAVQLVLGNYATGAAVAAMMTTAINAVTSNTYLVSYAPGTRLFTIARTAGAETFDLPWSTGPSAAQTVGDDIGFDTSADDTGLLSYTSDFPTRKSAEFLTYDLQTAMTLQGASLLESNADIAGGDVITIQGAAVADFSVIGFSDTFVDGDPDDTSKLKADFGSDETFRYWRVLFEDRDNPIGFTQAGYAFGGPFQVFDPAHGLNQPENRNHLSAITQAEQGAIATDVKPEPRRWRARYVGVDEPFKLVWDEISRNRKIGQHVFWDMDPLNQPLRDFVYGIIDAPGISIRWRFARTSETAPPEKCFDITVPFRETEAA